MATKITLFLCIVFIVTLLAQKQVSSSKLPVSQLHHQRSIQNQKDIEQNMQKYGISEGSLRPQECGGRCSNRCSKTSFKKPCMFFCQKCCAKCLCVPPGTYGNKQVCPCYNNWKTKRGGPKCP